MSAPDAALDKACKKLDLSISVTALGGIKETLSFAHSKAFPEQARVRDNRAYVTWIRMGEMSYMEKTMQLPHMEINVILSKQRKVPTWYFPFQNSCILSLKDQP